MLKKKNAKRFILHMHAYSDGKFYICKTIFTNLNLKN